MTFSPLTTTTVPTKNYGSRQGHEVSRLIIHYTAGGTDASNVDLMANSQNYGRSASCTYVNRRDGSLVGIVPEEFRPWTSGGFEADGSSVTVETVIAPKGDATAAQLETLARLAADLSTRYGWGRLTRKNVMGHREFANTDCPGPLWPLMDAIVARANAILDAPNQTPNQQAKDILDMDEKTLETIVERAAAKAIDKALWSPVLDPKSPIAKGKVIGASWRENVRQIQDKLDAIRKAQK